MMRINNVNNIQELMDKGNMVIARVWQSKNNLREVTTPVAAAMSGWNVGHVSLQLFQEGQLKLYVSFWPDKAAYIPIVSVNANLNTALGDHDAEGGPPDVVAYILNLDVKKAMDVFFKYIENSNNRPKYQLFPFAKSSVMRMASFSGDNCCSMVFDLVQQGLVNIGIQDDLIRTQLQGMQQQGSWLDPNIFAEFFKHLSEYEDRLFENMQLASYKANFKENIKIKFRTWAENAEIGNLYLYMRIFPEEYAPLASEIVKTVTAAEQKIRVQFKQYVDEGKLDALENLKQEDPHLYLKLKTALENQLQAKLALIERDAVEKHRITAEKRKKEVIEIINKASDAFVDALRQYMQNKTGYAAEAYRTYASTILGMLRKGRINELLNAPENDGIPSELCAFIFNYLYEYPMLLVAREYPEETKAIEVSILKNSSLVSANTSSTTSAITTTTTTTTTSVSPQFFVPASMQLPNTNLITFRQAVLDLVVSLQAYLADDSQTPLTFVATLLNAIRKERVIEVLASNENKEVPDNVASFFKTKWQLTPELHADKSLFDAVKQIEVQLLKNQLDVLRQECLEASNAFSR